MLSVSSTQMLHCKENVTIKENSMLDYYKCIYIYFYYKKLHFVDCFTVHYSLECSILTNTTDISIYEAHLDCVILRSLKT